MQRVGYPCTTRIKKRKLPNGRCLAAQTTKAKKIQTKKMEEGQAQPQGCLQLHRPAQAMAQWVEDMHQLVTTCITGARQENLMDTCQQLPLDRGGGHGHQLRRMLT
jgi:hypothetical protein